MYRKNVYLSFASATKVCVLCYLLAEYVTMMSSYCVFYLEYIFFWSWKPMSFSKLAAIQAGRRLVRSPQAALRRSCCLQKVTASIQPSRPRVSFACTWAPGWWEGIGMLALAGWLQCCTLPSTDCVRTFHCSVRPT